MGAFLVEGATRPGYDAMRQPVSSLAIGVLGWTQQVTFVATGLLLLALAFGLRDVLRSAGGSAWAPILVAAMGVGLIGAGLCTTDLWNGYPPGTPLVPVDRTASGVLHDLFSTLFFAGLPAACFVLGRWFRRGGRRGWARYSIGTGVAFIAAFVLTSVGLNQLDGLAAIAGLAQRATLALGFAWISALSVTLLRDGRREPAADRIRARRVIR